MLGFTCMLLCGFLRVPFAQRTAGAAGTRPSLHPLGYEGGAIKQSSGVKRRENAEVCLLSHPANKRGLSAVRRFGRLRDVPRT